VSYLLAPFMYWLMIIHPNFPRRVFGQTSFSRLLVKEQDGGQELFQGRFGAEVTLTVVRDGPVT